MMHRRHFLETLGVVGLSALGLGRALAQPDAGAAPKRLILVSHCHGWPYDAWKMRPPGVDVSGPWERPLVELSREAFSQPLAPLYAHRARMLALDGLSLATAELDMDGNRHDTGWVHAWTGNWADFGGTDTLAQSASLDQRVSAFLARPDRLQSLELSVDDVREAGRPISYAASGARLPVESAPARVWQRIFGPSRAPDPLAGRRKSVLDFAYGEYAALAPRLGTVQRQKLDAHFALLQRLGGRLEGMANLNCGGVPAMPSAQPTYNARFDAFADLIGAAFSCDVTRVVSLSLGEMPTADFGWDHLTDDVHKGLAHEVFNDPQKHQAMADYVTLHAEQIARLVTVLEGLPDIDGNSVMDNTLIVWGSEMANGWHGYQHYCPVIIGGDWHFRTGRYLYWPHETPIQLLTPTGYTPTSGMPHQRLLVSVAQSMGLDVNGVGIEHVQSQTGIRVECTGPLPGLA